MATLDDEDMKAIKSLMKETLSEDETLVRKDDISHLPSKDEFYEQNDKLMKELKDSREEQTVLSAHSKRHTNQFEKLKKIHPNYQHA